MIEGNTNRIARLEQEKDRLKTACRHGVISLEEYAQDRSAIDKEISDLAQAAKHLQEEVKPQILTEDDIATIEAFAAYVREGSDLADSDREAQREIFQTLNIQVVLFEENGQKWVDVSCVLGRTHSEAHFQTNYGTAWYTGHSNGRACGSVLRVCPFPTHRHFR